MHNVELHNIYGNADTIRLRKLFILGWAGNVARMRGVRIAHKLLIGKPERKRPAGRSKMSWEDNIIWSLVKVDYYCD